MFVPTTDRDVPSVVALMNEAYRSSGASAAWSTETAYISGDRTTEVLLRADLLARPQASLLKWVVPADGQMLGSVWLEPVGHDVWYLGSLAIRPDRQQSGLGTTLLSAAERWVLERGGVCVRMRVVNVREALIAWYLRRGYRLTGKTAPFPYDDHRFGVPLRDDLSFLVLEKGLAG